MSNLLINEYPLTVLPSLAVKIGLNEAIILQQFHYWMGRTENVRDGRKWIYNTYDEWNKQFPFWSRSTLIRAIKGLENKGLIISGNYNKMNLDKTKWYAIDYEAVKRLENGENNEKNINDKKVKNKLEDSNNSNENTYESKPRAVSRPSSQNDYIDVVKMSSSTSQNDHMDYSKWIDASSQNDYTNNHRLPETTTETNSEINSSSEDDYFLALKNSKLKEIAEYLLANEFVFENVREIVLRLRSEERLWRMDKVEQQVKYMRGLAIYDIPAYFMIGLRKRVDNGGESYDFEIPILR